MTVVVENNINDINMFRSCLDSDTILFPGFEGFLKFIALNYSNISTVVLDSCVDPVKMLTIVQYISSMFPNIKTVEYSPDGSGCTSGCMYTIDRPFDEDGQQLLESLSGHM